VIKINLTFRLLSELYNRPYLDLLNLDIEFFIAYQKYWREKMEREEESIIDRLRRSARRLGFLHTEDDKIDSQELPYIDPFIQRYASTRNRRFGRLFNQFDVPFLVDDTTESWERRVMLYKKAYIQEQRELEGTLTIYMELPQNLSSIEEIEKYLSFYHGNIPSGICLNIAHNGVVIRGSIHNPEHKEWINKMREVKILYGYIMSNNTKTIGEIKSEIKVTFGD
jgi:hypothetical protein